MSNVENLQDHMAYSCKCGCVDFNLLKSGGMECAYCGEKLSDSVWGLKQPEQKPVAWRWGVPKLKNGDFEWRYSLNQTRPDAIPLYTTPSQRTWVNATTWRGLTDEVMFAIAKQVGFDSELMKSNHDRGTPSLAEAFARTIEAKLKEKNT